MARTLWGNILEMLAAGGIQTAGNIGGQFVGDYLKTRATERMLGTETGLAAAGAETRPEKQQEILRQLKGRIPLPTVTETGFAPMGETPTLSTLGQRENLTYPAETYAPASVERIVGPRASLDQVLADKLARSSEDSPIMRGFLQKKLGVGMSPYQEEQLGIGKARLTQQEKQYQQTQERLGEQFQSSQEFREIMGQGMMDFRSSMLQMQMQNQRNQMMMFGDKMEAGARAQLEKHWDNIQKILADPDAMREGIALEPAVEQYNSALNSVIKQNPALGQYFYPLDPIKSSTWVGREKVTGVKQRPSGPTTLQPPAGPTPLTFPRRVRVDGKEMIVNSQEEYDALRQGASQ